MRTWICDICHRAFYGEPDNEMKLTVEKPDCEWDLVIFDVCTKCDENTTLGEMYWRNKIVEILKNNLHSVCKA